MISILTVSNPFWQHRSRRRGSLKRMNVSERFRRKPRLKRDIDDNSKK